jgi:hypothetical protein
MGKMTSEPMQPTEGHSCVLPFDTDNSEFVRGFEAGRIWSLLCESGDELELLAHGQNAEMFLRMAEATGRQVRSEELGGEWISVSFSEKCDTEDLSPWSAER